jgi:chromate transporter
MNKQIAGPAEITKVFLKIGAMSYGGPAIMGIMQAEIQEKREWMSKQEFVDGLAVVNMLPGPGATQLGIFIGHQKAGLIGGVIAGICFILPAFLIMLALAAAYMAFGTLPLMRNAFYGIGPVVVGIFAASVYRLGKATIRDRSQIAIAAATAILLFCAPVGLVMPLMTAGCVGILLFNSCRNGLIALSLFVIGSGVYYIIDTFLLHFVLPSANSLKASNAVPPDLWGLGIFFFKVGALTFGGGLSMLAFIQEQVVNQFGWLTPKEFVDGLALGQLTPGPILMLAAYIGFKLAGTAGAAVAASAIFLPSFLMMLSVLPLLRKLKDLQWLRAFMRGVGPAVIGALAVSLVQVAPHAAPDIFTWVVLAVTIGIILLRNIGPLPLMASGGVIGLISRGNVIQRFGEFVR